MSEKLEGDLVPYKSVDL